jgi:hypothetical protein
MFDSSALLFTRASTAERMACSGKFELRHCQARCLYLAPRWALVDFSAGLHVSEGNAAPIRSYVLDPLVLRLVSPYSHIRLQGQAFVSALSDHETSALCGGTLLRVCGIVD